MRLCPQEYACIGCEVTVAEHETVFESRQGRLLRGAAVDEAYLPLSNLAQGDDAAQHEEMNIIRERAFAPPDYSSNANVRIRPSPTVATSRVLQNSGTSKK